MYDLIIEEEIRLRRDELRRLKRHNDEAAREFALTLGANVRERRQAMGWSQEKLSRRIDKSRETVRRCEAGIGFPHWGSLAVIASVLGVSLWDLLPDKPEYRPGDEQDLGSANGKRPFVVRPFGATRQKVAELLDEGMTPREISIELGVTTQTVYQHKAVIEETRNQLERTRNQELRGRDSNPQPTVSTSRGLLRTTDSNPQRFVHSPLLDDLVIGGRS